MKKFEKLVSEIGKSFSISVNKLIQPRELRVFQLGKFTMVSTGEVVDLSRYYIDGEGDMYTLNERTAFTDFGTHLKQVSNNALDAGGYVTNSFRGTSGRKITIRRRTIRQAMYRGDFGKVSFDELPVVQGKVETKNFSASIT